MRKNNIIFGVLIGLVVCLTASLSMTYARYVTNLSDIEEQTVTVARWNFEADNPKGSIYSFTFDTTYNENTLVDGKIAPGTTGHIDFVLSNETSEVAADYTIDLTLPEFPRNLKFYITDVATSDPEGKTEITNGAKLVGTLPVGTTSHSRTLYWEWPYDTTDHANDAQDTLDGQTDQTSIENNKFVFAITGVQSAVFDEYGTALGATETKSYVDALPPF